MKKTFAIITTFAVVGCSATNDDISAKTAVIDNSHKQLVVVVAKDNEAIDGTLYRFELKNNSWQQLGDAHQVVLGRTGLAWGIGLHPKQIGQQKQEGDGKAPAGIFELGTAFGYLDSLQTNMTYQGMSADDYCIDVQGSPFYNQLVDKS
ncbi:MAG: hypothetical protein ACTILD_11395, partial [Pseudoalteromonas sp.]